METQRVKRSAWIASLLLALLAGKVAGRTAFDERFARSDSLLSRRQADASLKILDSLLIESRRARSGERELQVLLAQARLHGILGRPVPGRAAATGARELAAARRDTLALCKALRWLSLSAELEGSITESRAYAQELISLARRRGDREHEAHGALLLAYGDMSAGNLSSAERGYVSAAALFRQTGDLRFELMALTGLGRIRDNRGDIAGARVCYEQALEGSRRLGDPFNEADALNNLGGLEFTFGDPSAARGFYQRALDIQIKNGNLAGSIVPAKNLAVTCTYMGELDEAAEILSDADRRCDEMGYRGQKAMLLEQLGIVRREQGRLNEACDLFRRAATTSDGSPEELGRILIDLAETLQYGDSLEMGAEILRDRFAALRPRVSPGLDFTAEKTQGEILFRLGRVTEAAGHFRRADRLGRAAGLNFRVAPLTYLARCHALDGRGDSARVYLGRAIEAWESERARLRDPGWREQFDLDGRFLHTEVAHIAFADAAPGSPAERCRFVFDALQRFKARTLRERMLGAVSLISDSSAAAQTGAVTLAELQERWLRPDEVLVDFFFGTDGLYLFGVTRAECRVRRILLPPDRLQTILRRYRDLTAAPREAPQASLDANLLVEAERRLSDLLFSPVIDLLRTHGRIVVSPDGLLNMIPLESLSLAAVDGDAAPAEPLIAWRRISRTPSASIFRDQRSRRESRRAVPSRARLVALLGDEGPADEANPGEYGEASWLRDSIRNVSVHRISADTMSHACRTDLASSSVIHLASHVLVDDVHPWRSGLRQLRAQEIAEMDLPAQLAVLAGCESAGGRVVSGEGVLGLATAFTAATVPAVIATLWPISDRVTGRFMKTFYAELAGGADAGSALHSAQLQTRDDPATSHPFYWAGFVLVGDGDEVVRLQRKPLARIPRRLASAVAVLAGLSGILWWIRRRTL